MQSMAAHAVVVHPCCCTHVLTCSDAGSMAKHRAPVALAVALCIPAQNLPSCSAGDHQTKRLQYFEQDCKAVDKTCSALAPQAHTCGGSEWLLII